MLRFNISVLIFFSVSLAAQTGLPSQKYYAYTPQGTPLPSTCQDGVSAFDETDGTIAFCHPANTWNFVATGGPIVSAWLVGGNTISGASLLGALSNDPVDLTANYTAASQVFRLDPNSGNLRLLAGMTSTHLTTLAGSIVSLHGYCTATGDATVTNTQTGCFGIGGGTYFLSTSATGSSVAPDITFGIPTEAVRIKQSDMSIKTHAIFNYGSAPDVGTSGSPYGTGYFTNLNFTGTCTGCVGTQPFTDASPLVFNAGTPSKTLTILASSIATSTNRNWTAPNYDLTVAGKDVDNTWTSTNTPNATNTYNWGSSSKAWNQGFFTNIASENVVIAQPSSTFGTHYQLTLGTLGSGIFSILDTSGNPVQTYQSAAQSFLYMNLLPSVDNTYSLGNGTSPLRWKKIFTGDFESTGLSTLGTIFLVSGASSSILPTTGSTYDLGSSGATWGHAYVDNFFAGTSSVSGLPGLQLTNATFGVVNSTTASGGLLIMSNSVTGIQVQHSGAAAALQFYGSGSAVTQQTVTGSRGGNAALASLLTALAATGLIIDSSTP